MFSKKQGQHSAPQAPRAMSNGSTFSVIGPDVTIRGDMEASVDLHVDGRVLGDISCASLVQGEGSEIEGAVTAERARLSGRVKGTIAARELVILKTARIDGDVSYETLTIEQGAAVNGRFSPKGAVTADETGEPRLAVAG